MTFQEKYNELSRKLRETEEQLKQLTIDVLISKGADSEENAYCYEDDTPYLNVEGKYSPTEVTVDKIWFNEDEGLMALLTPTGFDDPWEQNLEDLTSYVSYADILWFMDLSEE